MFSTRRPGVRRGIWLGAGLALLMPLCAWANAGGFVSTGTDGGLPDPPQLARDVRFWVRVYTQIDTNAGFLHDQYDLAVIYRTLRFAPDSSPRERQRIIDRAREHIAAQLRRIASGRRPLTRRERRIKALWGPRASPKRLREAAGDIRFQLGQSNRFRAGLVRSGAWQHAIARALKRAGLPPELAALPLVESSYNPRAYSKDGAAGLWQFMPSTGRRFLTIDRAVDDRLDPFRATDAAAQLLAYNYRILGTWPLAITAYNQGVAGVRRAVRALGTNSIVALVRRYHSRMFGFASRNFYVAFLAALEVERHARRYFGVVHKLPETHFREVAMPAYVAVGPLEHVLHIGTAALRDLNPALRPLVWAGALDVPKGYLLRVPAVGPTWTQAMLVRRLGPRQLLAAQPVPPSYRVRRGDTLSGIAARYRVGLYFLARYNGIRPGALLHIGERILLPHRATPRAPTLLASAADRTRRAPSGQAQGTPPPAVPSVALAANPPLAKVSPTLQAGPQIDLERRTFGSGHAASPAEGTHAQPVSDAQAQQISATLGPGGGPSQNADPTDYTVASNGTIRVAAAESLGYYAEWLNVSAWDLRRVNHLRFHQPVRIGERIHLDFRHVSPGKFERERLAYHRALQSRYFDTHHIEGTRIYLTRSGDSLWSLTRRFPLLPAWLLRQYNPDTDFSALQPRTRLVIPRIEMGSAGG